MKQLLFSLAILALVITLGCGGGTGMSNSNNSSAKLRAIQTSPDTAFDVQLDGHSLFAAKGKVAYTPVAVGSHTLQVTAPGTNAALATLPATFAANTGQTVIVSGATEDRSLTAFMVTEDTTPPAAGQIKLRFVHGAHSFGPVDIYLTDAGTPFPQTPTYAGLAYKGESTVLTRPAKDFSLCWTAAATTPALGGLGGGPACAGVGTYQINNKSSLNSTFVLPDPPNIPNAPPGTFVIIQFYPFPN
jgi:hypothetical protein